MGLIDKVIAAQGTAANLKLGVGGDGNLENVITKATGWIGTIAGVIAFFFLIYSGFIYLTAGGNADQAKKGGQGIINAVLGLIIIALAYALTRGIVQTLGTGA